MTQSIPRAPTCRLLAVTVVVLFALTGCEDDGSKVNVGGPAKPDTGADAGADAGADIGADDDVGVDTGPDTGDDTGPLPTSNTRTSLFCGAGGVSSGDAYRVIHCTGPGEVAGQTAQGAAYQVQVGGFQLVTP